MDPSLTVTVIDPRGISRPVRSWTALLILKLLDCHDEINAMTSGKITCDCGESGVRIHQDREVGRKKKA